MVPKILFFDIETAGVQALKSDLGFVTMFGYKWGHEKKAKIITVTKNELHHFNDGPLLKKTSAVYNEADITVGHFASVFDRRFIQGRLLINGLPAIPFTRMRDTCFIARSVANYSSNRLKYLAKIFHFKNQKLENNWPDAWFQVMRGNMKVLKEMADYCKGDVLATEELYHKLLPFDNAHPRIYFDVNPDGEMACGHCGGQVRKRGLSYVGVQRYRRFQCKGCGKWGRGRKAVK